MSDILDGSDTAGASTLVANEGENVLNIILHHSIIDTLIIYTSPIDLFIPDCLAYFYRIGSLTLS
jgi:hypothetical protein